MKSSWLIDKKRRESVSGERLARVRVTLTKGMTLKELHVVQDAGPARC